MKKEPKDKTTMTAREVSVLLEGLRSEFRVFGDKLKAIDDKIDSTMGMVAKNTEDITMLNIKVGVIKDEITKINGKLAQIESKLAKVEDKLSLHLETSHT